MTSLRWITEFWFLALAFPLAWAVFFYGLIVRWPLTMLQWRQVDFIWLALTAISILFMAADAQTLLAGNLTAKEEVVQKEQRSFQAHVTSERDFYCRRFPSALGAGRDDGSDLGRQVQLHCDWL